MKASKSKQRNQGEVTRYTHPEVHETRVPETGHTSLLSAEEETVDLVMENGWANGVKVGTRSDLSRPLLIDMDPIVDPVLFWSGKRSRRTIPILPLQRNEIISESKIRQIVETAKEANLKEKGQTRLSAYFAELERSLRESDRDRRVEFYTHDGGWKNKLVSGDSLLLMEAMIRYEGLRGGVQTIYFDPPYGIRYDSNFQQRVDTTRNNDSDSSEDVVTVKAFRDTWTLGIHTYLSFLQERLYLCRELLSETGSIFVQMGIENSHLVRAVLDEVFGAENFLGQIVFRKTSAKGSKFFDSIYDVLLWYGKNREVTKFNRLYVPRSANYVAEQYTRLETPSGEIVSLTEEQLSGDAPLPIGRRFEIVTLSSQSGSEGSRFQYRFKDVDYLPPTGRFWPTNREGLDRLAKAGRIIAIGRRLYYKKYEEDAPVVPLRNIWDDTITSGFSAQRWYVVQTPALAVERTILMTSDPGDLVFDPTSGGGTTACAAEKWGRRWVACDTSRVACNVSRLRLLSSVFPLWKLKGPNLSGGFECTSVTLSSLGTITGQKEPETVAMVDHPLEDPSSIRVAGPFESLSVGRYSIEDWKGSFSEGGTVENYISVICRLYRKDAALQTSKGLIHAIVESQNEKFAISVGPISGRVTAKQLNDAAQDALACGLLEVHVLGWAFEANVGEIKSKLEAQGEVRVNLVVIRPDTLMEGLKSTQPGMLFSPLSVPDVRVNPKRSGRSPKEFTVSLEGVGVFDREKRITDYKKADSGYVAAWYLDEDYDGDCFVDCQMFFDFKRVPNLSSVLSDGPDSEEFELKIESAPFSPGKYSRIAVKVVDVYGNESTVVKNLPKS
jgi:adenine-specific DNA-methyltransferase